MNRFAHVRIQMHWIDKIRFRILLRQCLDSLTHLNETLPKILAAVSGNKNKATIPDFISGSF